MGNNRIIVGNIGKTSDGFHSHGGTPKWTVYIIKIPARNEDDWRYPHDLGNLHLGIVTQSQPSRLQSQVIVSPS